MKTIASIFVGILVVVGYISFMQDSTVATFGDGMSIVSNTTKPTNASSSALTTSTLLVATSTSRNYLLITNDSANTVYLGLGAAAVSGKGIRLASGTSFEMKSGQNLFTAAIWGISTATSNVTYIESNNQ